MVIGRRRDVPVRNRSLYLPDSVENVAEFEGKLHRSYGIDYFAIAGNVYPWHMVPDLVIGRPAYDNFLVSTASLYNMSVVDATDSVVALHQTDAEGTRTGHHYKDSNYNRNILARNTASPACWRTDCTKYLTKMASSNDLSTTKYLSNCRRSCSVVVVKRTSRNLNSRLS